MKIIFTILITICTLTNFAQNNNKVPTIPLNQNIKIKITSIDSTTFRKYIVYDFKYKRKRASFWAIRQDKIFRKGIAEVALCRILQMRDNKNGEGITLRGCAFYNGLGIMDGEKTVKLFNFNEFSLHPTLRLCTTDSQ